MRKHLSPLLIACTLLYTLAPHRSNAQNKIDSILARVGSCVITQSEFHARYSLTIFPYKDASRNQVGLRRAFLYSLIAEKLLAEEAKRRNVDQEASYRKSLHAALEMFMRDKLYREVVQKRVTVAEQEIRQRFEERLREVEFQFISRTTEDEIENIARLLKSGISFDTLLDAQRQQNDPQPGDTHPVDADLRRSIRNLHSGEISNPIKTKNGFYIVRKMPELTNEGKEELFLWQRKEIERELRSMKEVHAVKKYVTSLWKGKKAIIEKDQFTAIGRTLANHLRAQYETDTSDVLSPSIELFDKLRADVGLMGEKKFCSIGTDSITISRLIDQLQGKSIMLKREEMNDFPKLFRSIVNELLDVELVTREAYRRQLHEDSEVKSQLSSWVENGLAQSLAEDVVDQFIASDDSLWEYYRQYPSLFGAPIEATIFEVTSTSDALLNHLRSLAIRSGSLESSTAGLADAERARIFAKKRTIAPIESEPDLGNVVLGMRGGEMSRVLLSGDISMVFQLLEKRRRNESTTFNYDSLRAMTNFTSGLKQRLLERMVRELATEEAIQIHEEKLHSLVMKPMQMFTIRYLGFGGRIPAAPSVMPLYEAVLEGMKLKKQVQP